MKMKQLIGVSVGARFIALRAGMPTSVGSQFIEPITDYDF